MRTSLRIVILSVTMLAGSAFSTGQIITGGFSELPDAGSDPAVGHLMDFLASEVRNSLFQGEACEITVDNVDKVERQVVAGMNYRVTVSLKSSCVIPGGASESIITCEKIRVFQPLPHQCTSPNPDNPKCMETSEMEKCSSDRDDLPPVEFLAGGFSELTDRAELNDVLDFAKIEAKNSLLGNYGSGDCADLELDDLGKAESQVVAGTNYRITFSLKSTCAGSEVAISCEEVIVYKPLGYACQNPNPDNPKCMEVSEGLDDCRVSLK